MIFPTVDPPGPVNPLISIPEDRELKVETLISFPHVSVACEEGDQRTQINPRRPLKQLAALRGIGWFPNEG